MYKVTVRLYRAQYAALTSLLPNPREYSLREMVSFRLEDLILLEYRSRITPQNVFTWSNRPTGKRYALTLSLPVARALWTELQSIVLTADLQGLLSEIDHELKNIGLEP